ncbi:MAG: pentapeptide repeat-containing protein [Acidobacteriia bacterium]|nr:pentapeptide repeat-containing protein [Terriglobia bacterium]
MRRVAAHGRVLSRRYLCHVHLLMMIVLAREGADIRAVLREGRLNNANLDWARPIDAHLHGANLDNAKLCATVSHGARFTGARLQGADLAIPKLRRFAPLLRRTASAPSALDVACAAGSVRCQLE